MIGSQRKLMMFRRDFGKKNAVTQFLKTYKSIKMIFFPRDLPIELTEPMNISRYEGHRYAFEIHQYT